MIDKDKIKSAAQGYCDATYGTLDTNPFIAESFRKGAKWAINEFLKNLWHPAIEKPKRRCNYLLLHYKDKEEECFEADVVDTKAWDCYIKDSLVEYINIDDLLPKKGSEQ